MGNARCGVSNHGAGVSSPRGLVTGGGFGVACILGCGILPTLLNYV